jgi:hypothetical protein
VNTMKRYILALLLIASTTTHGMEQPPEANNPSYTKKEVDSLISYAQIFKKNSLEIGIGLETVIDPEYLLALLEIFSLHHLIPVELAAQIIISDKTMDHKLLCARLQQVGFTSKATIPEDMSVSKAHIFKDFIVFSEGKFDQTIFKPDNLAESHKIKRIGRYDPIFVTDNGGVLFEGGHLYKYIHGTQELNFNTIWVTAFFFDNGITYKPLACSQGLSISSIYYKIITQKLLSIGDIKKHLLRTNLILPDRQMTIDLANDRCTLSESKYYADKIKSHIDYFDVPTIVSSDNMIVVTTYSREIPTAIPTLDIWTIKKDGTTTHTNTFTLPGLNSYVYDHPLVSVFGKIYVEQRCGNGRSDPEIRFVDCTNGKHICILHAHKKNLMTFAHDKLILQNKDCTVEVWQLGELTGSKILALQNYKTNEPTIFALTKNAPLKLLEQKRID